MARSLRLMTWNLRSLRDDRDAVVEVLRRCAPDVLFVQEAPRFLRAATRLAALARESGLVAAGSGRPSTGVAILTTMRIEVAAVGQHRLPRTPRLHRRGVAVAELALGQRTFRAASIHLGLDADERRRHAGEIEQLLRSPALPTVLGGDFNELHDGDAWRVLAAGRRDPGSATDEPTFPARNPRRRIDGLLVPPEWQATPVSPLEIVDESDLHRATDHRPAILDVVG